MCGPYEHARRPRGSRLPSGMALDVHTAWEHALYFTDVFGRPLDTPLPWTPDASDPSADMWARPDETRNDIDGAVGLLEGCDNVRVSDVSARQALHDRIEEAARLAAGG